MMALPSWANWKIAKEDREKLLLAVLLAGIILAGGHFLILSGAWKNLAKAKKENHELRARIAEAKDMLADQGRVKRVSGEITARMQSTRDLVPEETDSSWILRLIGDVEKSQDLRTVAIKPVKEEDVEQSGGHYKVAVCQIEFKTDYHSLGRFVDQLEHRNPYLRIKDVTVESSPDDVANHQVSFKVQYLVSRLKKINNH